MADEEFGIKVPITADDSDFQKAIERVTGGLEGWGIDFGKIYEKGSEFFKGFGIDIDKFSEKLGTTGPALLLVTGALIGLAEAGKEVAKVIAECTQDFAEDEIATIKFTSAVEASGFTTEGSAESLEKLAINLASTTGESNAAAESQIAMLLATGRNEEQIKNMIIAAKGLATATGIDLDTALTQVNATFSGSIGKLGKMTPALKDLTTEDLENGKAVDVLVTKYGSFSDKLDDSTDVSLKNYTNAWGELRGAIGGIAETYIKPIRDEITKLVTSFTDWINGNEGVKITLDILIPILAGATAGAIAFAIAVSIGPIVTLVSGAMEGLTIAIKAVTAAMVENPAGLLAAILTGVLIPAIILIATHWDDVKFAMATTWATITTLFEVGCANIKLFFATAFDNIKIAMADFAKVYVDTVMGSIQNLLKLGENIPGIGDSFKAAGKSVEGFKENIDDSITSAKDDAKQSILTANTAKTQAEERGKVALAKIKAEKDARKESNDKDIEGTKDTKDKAIKADGDRELSAYDLSKLMNEYTYDTQKVNEDALKYLGEQNKSYYDEQTTNENTLVKLKTDNAKLWEDTAKSIVDTVGGNGAAVFDSVTKSITDITKAAATGFLDVGADIAAVSDIISLAGKANADKFKDLQDSFGAIGTELLDIISPILSIVLDILLDTLPILQEMMPIIDTIFDLIEPMLPIWEAMVKISFAPILLELKAVNFILENMKNVIEPVRKEFEKFGDWANDSGKDISDGFITGIKDTGKNVWSKVKSIFTDIFTKIGEVFKTISDVGGTMVSGFITGIITVGATIWNAVSTVFTDFFHSVILFFGLDVAANVLYKISEKLINGFVSGMTDTGNKLWDKVGSPFTSFMTDATTKFAENFIKFNQFGQDTITNFINGLLDKGASLWTSVSKVFTDFMDSANSALGISTTTSFLYNIGKNVVDGFIKGIVDFGGSIWTGVRSIFTGFWDSVASFFGVASPSRLFIELGGNIVQGLVNGINGKVIWDNVETVFSNFTTSIVAFFGASSTIGANIVTGIGNGIKTAMEGTNGIWKTIKPGFESIATGIETIFDGVVTALKSPVNGIVTMLNKIISGFNTLKISFGGIHAGPIQIDGFDWGINIPSIPLLAKGTENWRGGMAIVGEQGPELVNIPRGSSVTPAGQTADLLSGGNKTYNFYSPVALTQQEIIAQMKQADREMAFSGVAG